MPGARRGRSGAGISAKQRGAGVGQGGRGTFAPFVPCRGRAGAAPCCGASPRRANRGGRSWAAAREQRPARGSLCSPVKNQPEARRHKFTTCLMPVRTLYMEKLQRSIFFFHHVMLYTQQRHKVADSGRTPRLSLPTQLSTCRPHTHTQHKHAGSALLPTQHPAARPSQLPVSRTQPRAPLAHTRQSERHRLGAEGHSWRQEHRQQRAAAVAQGLRVLSTLPPPQGGTMQ